MPLFAGKGSFACLHIHRLKYLRVAAPGRELAAKLIESAHLAEHVQLHKRFRLGGNDCLYI